MIENNFADLSTDMTMQEIFRLGTYYADQLFCFTEAIRLFQKEACTGYSVELSFSDTDMPSFSFVGNYEDENSILSLLLSKQSHCQQVLDALLIQIGKLNLETPNSPSHE